MGVCIANDALTHRVGLCIDPATRTGGCFGWRTRLKSRGVVETRHRHAEAGAPSSVCHTTRSAPSPRSHDRGVTVRLCARCTPSRVPGVWVSHRSPAPLTAGRRRTLFTTRCIFLRFLLTNSNTPPLHHLREGSIFFFCESSLLRINQRHHSLGLGYGTHHRRQ